MDFKLRVTETFRDLAQPDVIPGTVEFDDGEYVYRERANENRQYAQIPNNRYMVRANLQADREEMLKIKGLEAVAKGELAVLALCGGQATRLGADRPKGTFDLGLPAPFSTLLSLQAGQIQRLKALAKEHFPSSNVRLPWYVMVSKSTNAQISKHLADLSVTFGIPKNDIVVFEQREIPAFDFGGHTFKQCDGSVFTAPNGNGGIYDALKAYLPDLEKRGVKYVHTYCVDNMLCRVGDPVFVGLSIDMGADCAAKVVEKKDPSEKVGVICLDNGRPVVVEYSELPVDLAHSRTDCGQLQYRAGSIANHFFTVDFLRRACELHLPYHIARKKIPFVDESTQKTVKPNDVNGVKLERFIFDVFAASENFLVYQVDRFDEFSPLKNADTAGVDCPSTCRSDLKALHQRWLISAGIPEELRNKVELLSPLSTYEGEGISEQRLIDALDKNSAWLEF